MKENTEEVQMANSTDTDRVFLVTDPLEIHPIALIFPQMHDEDFKKLKEDISVNDLLEPIVIWEGKVIDGRHRYNACRELEKKVWAVEWEGGMDPVDYVAAKNSRRRHLTPSEKATAAAKAIEWYSKQAKERQREHGETAPGRPKSLSAPGREVMDDDKGKATEKVANLFDTSPKSVERAKFVRDHGTDEEKQELEAGKTALKPLEEKVRKRVNTSPKTIFNKTTDSIEWAKWTWNPVTGCRHECPYCDARDIANQCPDEFPNGFTPTFHPERLEAPANTELPELSDRGKRSVLVCSMGDLFGEWVEKDWIDQVISTCEGEPDWTFIFLTKNPRRLVGIEWPKNAWVGTAVDTVEKIQAAVEAFKELREKGSRPAVTFLSCEPMLAPLDFGPEGLSSFDWVIIGGCDKSSGMKARQPEWAWIWKLTNAAYEAGCKVYWKSNLKCRPADYPEE